MRVTSMFIIFQKEQICNGLPVALHWLVLQMISSVLFPAQGNPAGGGLGLLHKRILDLTPLSHVLLQVVQDPQ